MKRISEILGSTFGFLFSLILIAATLWFEFGGIYHSATKHDTNDLILSVCVPPWAWYRAVEILWHEDNTVADWDTKLGKNFKTIVKFLNQATDIDANEYKLNKNIDDFSADIKKYPEDKKKYLKDKTKLFIEYTLSLCEDLIVFLNNKLEGTNKKFLFSNNSLELENKLSDNILKETIEKSKNKFISSLDSFESVENKDFKNMKHNKELLFEKFKETYQLIFEEPLKGIDLKSSNNNIDSIQSKDEGNNKYSNSNKDLKTCIVLLNTANLENANKNELKNKIKDFSSTIKSYSSEILDYLKDKSRTYIDFQLSLVKDNYVNAEQFINSGEFKNEMSEETIKLRNKLRNTSLNEEIEKNEKKSKEIVDLMKEMRKDNKIENNYQKNLEKSKNYFRKQLKGRETFYKKAEKIYKDTYEKIFNESY